MSDFLEKDSINIYEDVEINHKIGRADYYEKNYPGIAKNNTSPLKYLLKSLLNSINMVMLRHRAKSKRIVIWEDKFQRIIDEQSDTFTFIVFTNSLTKYKELKKRKYIVFFCHNWMKWIDKGYLEKNENYTGKGVKILSEFLDKIKASAIILGNDKMFVEKTFQMAGRVRNIPVVIIQHGIYNIDSFEKLRTADSAEYFWTWSEYVKNLYLESFKNKTTVQVIGYPFKYEVKPINTNRVLFIGNHYLDYDREEGIEYIGIAKKVKQICEKENLPFSYRPHPSEKITSEYGDIKLSISSEPSLFQDILNSKIIIGDVSSCMIEASLMERFVIQIVWSERSQIVIDDPIYSFSEKVRNSSLEIYNAIKKCILLQKAPVIDSYYLYINKNFKEDTYRLLKEIIG